MSLNKQIYQLNILKRQIAEDDLYRDKINRKSQTNKKICVFIDKESKTRQKKLIDKLYKLIT